MSTLITVCDKCLQASCWQGIFMCQEAQSAGIVQKTREELAALNRENPSYWNTDSELESEAGGGGAEPVRETVAMNRKASAITDLPRSGLLLSEPPAGSD